MTKIKATKRTKRSPYFDRTGEAVELRIPLTAKQAATIKEIVRVSQEKEQRVAREMGGFALLWLKDFTDPFTERAEHFAIECERNYEVIITMIDRFVAKGWSDGCYREVMLREMQELIDENERDPEEVEWLKGMLKTYGNAEAPEAPAEVAA
jgi:hypothetical protein